MEYHLDPSQNNGQVFMKVITKDGKCSRGIPLL